MMKFAVLFALLFVSTHASPFISNNWYQHNNPNKLDTPDDSQEQVAAAGGAGAADQAAATTMAPEADSSDSSSSSSSEEGTEAPDAPDTTDAPDTPDAGAAPVQGAGQTAGGTGGTDAEQSSNSIDVVGGPIYEPQAGGAQPQAGDTSTQNADPAVANPLNIKPQAIKEREAKRSGAAIALTTMLLVAGVAAVSIVAYKYKSAISARLGL